MHRRAGAVQTVQLPKGAFALSIHLLWTHLRLISSHFLFLGRRPLILAALRPASRHLHFVACLIFARTHLIRPPTRRPPHLIRHPLLSRPARSSSLTLTRPSRLTSRRLASPRFTSPFTRSPPRPHSQICTPCADTPKTRRSWPTYVDLTMQWSVRPFFRV
ncbi:hypothetical protein C8R45DRAFT_1115768 [Mycena sanguinolenta]|nr:hypothetical protein C8R45DRAFT_1115768 [Mycena sanguinolenta]